MKKYFFWIILSCLTFGVGLFLAITQYSNQIVFGFDQARDAFEAYAIWHNYHFKILGPSTDIPGVSHGVLWYYFLAAAYFMGHNVSSAVLISLLAFFLSVPLLGLLVHRLFKNLKITCLTVSLFVLSPLFQVFTRWLSNPSLALLVTPVLLLFLWQYLINPSRKIVFLVGLSFGALIQTDFAYVVMLLLAPIYYWYFKCKFNFSHFILFGSGFLLAISSFILAEFKFGGQTFLGIAKFFLREGANPEAGEVILSLFNRIFGILSITVLPWPKLAAMIFLLFIFFKLRKEKFRVDGKPVIFLLIWLSGFIVMQILSSAVSGSAHILAAFIFPVTILFAYFLYHSRLTIFIFLILFSQVITLSHWSTWGYSPLSVQRGMFLSSEQAIVDYTYREANGKPFIINGINNPLYINTTWAFLYEFYGLPKYGYLPFWGGRDQAGLLGNLPQKPFGEDRRYLIIEDQVGINEFYLEKLTYEEDKVSDIVEEKTFGKLRVQKRIFHSDKGAIPMPQLLQQASPNLRE